MAIAASCSTPDPAATAELAKDGATGARDLSQLVDQLQKPRSVWVMLPAGEITEKTIVDLSGVLQAGDMVIDGGNTYYRDDIRRAGMLREKGIDFIDVGNQRRSVGTRPRLLHDDWR